MVRGVGRGMSAAAVAGLLAAGGASAADRYAFTVQTASSQFDLSVSASVPTTGTLIGDFDAASNPAGTRTKPGIFGTFGDAENVPVPLTVTGVIAGVAATTPAGSFTLRIDPEGAAASISGLSINLLGSTVPAITARADILWSTFRTRNPTCIVPGGFTIPFPLGSATLTTFTLSQTGGAAPATGSLTPGANPDEFILAVLVPVTITTEIAISGQPATGPQAQQATIALGGTLTIEPGGQNATLALALEEFSQQQTLPGPIGDPIDLPFTEPICQGSLIFTLQLQSASLSISGDASLAATGAKQVPVCPCDFTGSGGLTPQDIYEFLGAWGAGEARADFNGVNGVTSQDIYDFLECWLEGTAGARPGC